VVSSITPGPNNAMLMASGVNFGFRRSLRHLLGVNLGFTFMVLCVGLGLHSVLDQFPQFSDLLRYLGTAYMLWIAWKLASAHPAPVADVDSGNTQRAINPIGFWAAAAFQWVNPKAWVMAVTCMSTYLPPNADWAQVTLLAGLFLVLGAPCSAFWVGFGQAMRRLLQQPKRLRLFNRVMAVALVASLYPMVFN
jgi:threonine/homoserine/homoserine lactone efflux protein